MKLIKSVFILMLLSFIPGLIQAKDDHIDFSMISSFDSAGSVTIPAEGGEVSISFIMLYPTPYDLLMDKINESISGNEDIITRVSVTGYSGQIEGTLILEFAVNDEEERVITLSSYQNSVDIIQQCHISSVFTLSANKTLIMHGEDIEFTLNGSTPSFRYELLRDGISTDSNWGDGTPISFHATGAGLYTAESSKPSVTQMKGSVLVSFLPFYTYSHDFTTNELVADCNGGVYRVHFEKNSLASDSELARIVSFYSSGASSEWNNEIRIDYIQGELVFICGPNMGNTVIFNDTWFRDHSSNHLTIRQPRGGELAYYEVLPSDDSLSIKLNGSQPFVEYHLFKNGEPTSSVLIGTGAPLLFSHYYGAGKYTVEASYRGQNLSMPGSVTFLSEGIFLSRDDNWIAQETYTEPQGLVNSLFDISYYNGLGDPEQIINVAASPKGGNIVTPIWYDLAKRADAKTFLPFVSSQSNTIKEERPFLSQQAFYSSLYGDTEGKHAFEQKVYSTSPSNRLLSQRKPGSVYKIKGKEVTYTYGSNASNSVLRIDWDAADGSIHVYGFYPKGELFTQSTEDEDGKVVIKYTDKLDRLVLSRAVSEDVSQDTYYVYDALNRLRWVIQPEGSERLHSQATWAIDSPEAQLYAFRYTYDGRGRLSETRLPGKDVEYTVFDPSGRPVARQDGNLRIQGRWLLVSYTPFGEEDREYLTGSNTFSRELLIEAFSTTPYPSYIYLNPTNILIKHFIYDNYPSWAPHPVAEEGIIIASELVDAPKGLLTGKEVADLSTLESSIISYSRSVFFYDKRGRLRQSIDLLPDGIMHRESVRYDYLGNTLRKKNIVSGPEVEPKTLDETYSYDNHSRVLASSASIRNSTATVIYEYDDLGRLTTKNLGNITQNDRYNLQGWLTERTAIIGGVPVYTQTLRYDSPLLGSLPQYSGNISEWEVINGSTSGTYGFSYDGFGRLSSSLRYPAIGNIEEKGQKLESASFGDELVPMAPIVSIEGSNSFTEKDITYDKNGNILAMKRYGRSSILPQDNLTYYYNGNQLLKLTGSANASFQFDTNGNMVSDGENEYSFNLIDKLSQVHQGHSLKAEYHFFADGTKFKALNGNGEGLIYIGPFVYTHAGNFESVNACGGDARFMSVGRTISPYYYITDHLGSVRVIADDGGNVVERNDYYPYGSRHSSGATYPILASNRQKFGGKEVQSMVDLDFHDFGARMYSPLNMSWTTMDPLSEKYYHISPYAYCAGNPVNLVDPDGMQWYSYTDKDGNTKYQYWEGEMPEEEQANYKNIQYVGPTYSDENNNTYYSLFGNRVPIKDENGSRLNYKLYKHLDKLFIRAYGGDDPDGVGSENFFEPEAVGREYIDFTYNGKNFKSIAGWFEVFDNEENSIGCIAATPNPKKPIISGRSGNRTGWRKNCGVGGAFATRTLPEGYYLQVHRKGAPGDIHIIDVAYNEAEAGKFAAALAKLFPLK